VERRPQGQVKRQDYEFGGMVSAAPMSGDWFHRISASARRSARVGLARPNNQRSRKARRAGEVQLD